MTNALEDVQHADGGVQHVEMTRGQVRQVAFLGVDPDLHGAACVLLCVDAPEDETAHGRVISCRLYDLPTRARDAGGAELDPDALRTLLSEALGLLPLDDSRRFHALVERPVVQGRMGRGNASVVTQGVNCGLAFAAVEHALWRECRGFCCYTVAWADGGSRGWRREAGLPPASTTAKRKADSLTAAALLKGGWSLPGEEAVDLASASHGRADALLLAEVARRRWLGTSTPAGPVVSEQRARTAAKAAQRRQEEERMLGSRNLTPKMRAEAVSGEACPDCDAPSTFACVKITTNGRDVVPTTTHRARVWAHRATLRPEPTAIDWAVVCAGLSPTDRCALALAVSEGSAVRRSGPLAATGWTVFRDDFAPAKCSDRRPRISEATHAWLVEHGLLRLAGTSGRPEYVPTRRALLTSSAWLLATFSPDVGSNMVGAQR